MMKKILLVALVVLLLSAPTGAENSFSNKWKREDKSIFVDTISLPVNVNGYSIGIEWRYPNETVSIPYKQAHMPFTFKHTLPFKIDPCAGELSFVSSYAGDNIEIKRTYCRKIPASYIDNNVAKGALTWVNKCRDIWRPVNGLPKCPLAPNTVYEFRHSAAIPAGERVVFDVTAEFNLPSTGKFNFTIPKPEWLSTAASDYNTSVGFDFNWTKVAPDANVMPVGDDRVHNEQDQAFYDQNLVAYWRFNDVNADGSGVLDDTNNGNNGLLIAGADVNAWGLWDTNAGFFDGVDDYVDVADTGTSLDFDASGQYTWAGWFKFNSDNPDYGAIVSKEFEATTGYAIYLLDNKLSFEDMVAVGTISGNSTLSAGTWYHFAITFDADDVRFYVNGVLDGSDFEFASVSNDTSPVKIGVFAIISTEFSGTIEELKIYNRALSAAEIAADYNAWMRGTYSSEIKDFGHAAASVKSIAWEQVADVNNSLTVDYRSCNDQQCAGETWTEGLAGGGIHTIAPAQNRYFQYKVNFDTNRQMWNAIRSSDADKGFYAKFSDANITYDIPPDVNTIFPEINTGTFDNSPAFTIQISKQGNVSYGFYYNQALDYNGSGDTNADGFLTINFYYLIAEDDRVMLVVNRTQSELGTNSLALAEVSGDYIFYMEEFLGVVPEDIEDTDLINAMKYGIFKAFADIGTSFAGIFLLIIGLGLIVLTVWLVIQH